jgi:hypothetical protein
LISFFLVLEKKRGIDDDGFGVWVLCAGVSRAVSDDLSRVLLVLSTLKLALTFLSTLSVLKE